MKYGDLSSMCDALPSTYEYKKEVLDCMATNGDIGSLSATASLSAVPNLNSIPMWDSGDKQTRLRFIVHDCRARLNDVCATNEKAKSLSAFMSILALIEMLAKLALPIYAKVYLTHRGRSEQTLAEMNNDIKQASASNEVSVTLDASFLCDELDSAIRKMFNDSRQEIKDSILKAFEDEPPILCTLSE